MKRFFLVRFALIFVLMVTVCGCGGGGSNGGGTTTGVVLSENFDGFAVGNNFTSSSWASAFGGAFPTWQVQEAGKALYVNTADDIVYAGSGSSSWTNYTFTFRFKVDNLAVVASAFVRFIGGSENGLSYYQVTVQNGNQLFLSKNPSDAAVSFVPGSATISYLANTYYPVEVVVNGDNIKVYFNNAATPDIDWTDTGPGGGFGPLQPAGSVGIGSPSGFVYFDDIVVTTF